MKKKLFLGLPAITLCVLFFTNNASAIVVGQCSQGNHTSTMWILNCDFTVFDHPDILGVTHVRSENSMIGSWWQNGVFKGTLGPALSLSLEQQITRVTNGGVTTMTAPNARATTQATKFLAGAAITWNQLCSYGEFKWKSVGNWVKFAGEPNDDEVCGVFSTE